MAVISLQGGMASGKTTLARRLAEEYHDITVSYEDISEAVKEVKRRSLDKSKLEDYIEIQRLFINCEIERYNQHSNEKRSIFIDSGPDEIEFYTVNYPKSIGENWDIERKMPVELSKLRECKIDTIIFLESSVSELRERKSNDHSRNRGFFEHYIDHLHNRKIDWFRKKDNVVMINTDNLSEEEVYQEVVKQLTAMNYL